jgi:hypothetical protein
MKKAWIALIAVAALALPASAAADNGHGHAVKNAARYCKSLRQQMGAEAFRDAYGGQSNAFGKCVSQRVHELRDARAAARQACREELSTNSLRHRGPHGNKHAFRRCVHQKLHDANSEDQQAVIAAIKTCTTELDADPAAFEVTYDGDSVREAFGHCVRQHLESDDESEPGDDQNDVDEPGEDSHGNDD